MEDKLQEEFLKFCDKYDKLVWYARSPHKSVINQVYSETPDAIIQGALNAQSKVQEMYPDECDELAGETGDWQHGFNSGCLATMRMVLTALYPETYPDDESDDENATYTYGGIKDALEEFPMLDT